VRRTIDKGEQKNRVAALGMWREDLFSILPWVCFSCQAKKGCEIFHAHGIDYIGSSFLATIEDGLGRGIKIGMCLWELLEKFFLIILLNFDLGRDFADLLEMLLVGKPQE
jgi:hypothetical protein